MLLLVTLLGCLRGPVDRFTLKRVVPAAMQVPDVDRVCRTGGALGHALVAVPRRTPHLAMVIADTTAALCDDASAREAALRALVARQAGQIGPTRDLLEAARRLRSRAALRHASAYDHARAVWPWIGDRCGKVAKDEELTFLVGLMAGTLAMLDDASSGGAQEVPLDTLARVGRAASCLDDARWFYVPSTFEAASWTLVPGLAPGGTDPWEALEEAARRGGDAGMRLGWALMAVLASNAGEEALVRKAITEAAASFERVPPPSAYRLLDAFARDLLQHEADLLAVAEQGYRARGLSFPVPPAPPAGATEDPFATSANDPFSNDDPFATDPEPR